MGSQHPPRTQGTESCAGDIGDPAGGVGQVAGGGEVKHPDHHGHRVAGIAEQLRRAGDPGQIDHPLQIGRPSGAELAGQMLPADPEPAGEGTGSNRPLNLAEEDVPGRSLERRR